MTQLPPDLARLGDELERATTADLRASAPRAARPRRVSRRLAIAIAVAVIGIPGVAIAANQLTSSSDVAASMPAGTLALAGTEPSCTVVSAGVEFHCVLAKAPAPEVSDWKGTVEPTVDATKHVNGGCRSLTSDGTEWECYLGQAAVTQQIIGQGFLGQASEGPGVG
ncbi:MAG: hypothetical protein ABI317_14495 [Gaiellales bacterium]